MRKSTSRPILKGGDELFNVGPVINFYYSVLEMIEDNDKPLALLLGCTKHKPYSKSFIHRKIISMLEKHLLNDYVQQYIIGEPLVVCPREMETYYPAAHYEFPPERLGHLGRDIFIKRLRKFFMKCEGHHYEYILFAPNHHKNIILTACKGIISPTIIPYNIYKLPDLLNIIKKFQTR
ncbi:MAG: DUF5591 domain-containing protein [Thermoplasmata archaeon]